MAEIESFEGGGMAPVQFEGKFKDGRYFYFRARHEHATLSASFFPPDPEYDKEGNQILGEAAKGKDAISVSLGWAEGGPVYRHFPELAPHGAGFMDREDAIKLLHDMASEIRDPLDTDERP